MPTVYHDLSFYKNIVMFRVHIITCYDWSLGEFTEILDK